MGRQEGSGNLSQNDRAHNILLGARPRSCWDVTLERPTRTTGTPRKPFSIS